MPLLCVNELLVLRTKWPYAMSEMRNIVLFIGLIHIERQNIREKASITIASYLHPIHSA
jgi:hypothetical protein